MGLGYGIRGFVGGFVMRAELRFFLREFTLSNANTFMTNRSRKFFVGLTGQRSL